MHNLQDLYIDQLQDLWSANRQAATMVGKLCDAVGETRLREKLEKSQSRIAAHNARLEEIIRSYDRQPDAEHCKGMEGLVKEAAKHALEEEITDPAVRDAQVIAQYQRMTHYGIAVYGTCRALAAQLGRNDEAALLDEVLQDVKKGDAVMTEIAEGSVNRKAA